MLREEVLLDDAEPDFVVGGHPVQGQEGPVVPLGVPTVAIDREVHVSLDEQVDVGGQRLIEPEARDRRHAAVLGHPEAGDGLQVRLRRSEGDLRPEVAEEHRVAADRPEGRDVGVESALHLLRERERREGSARTDEQLPIGFELSGLGHGSAQGEGRQDDQGQQAVHGFLRC